MTIGRLTLCSPTGASYEPSAPFASIGDASQTKLCTPGIGTRYHNRQSSITAAGGRRRRLSRPVKTVTWSTNEPMVLFVDYDYDRTPWVPANPSAETMRRWAAGVGLEDDDDGDDEDDDGSSEELASSSDDGSLDDSDSFSTEDDDERARAGSESGSGTITPPPGLVEDEDVSSQATTDDATPREDSFILATRAAATKKGLHLVCSDNDLVPRAISPGQDEPYEEVSPTSGSTIRAVDRLPSLVASDDVSPTTAGITGEGISPIDASGGTTPIATATTNNDDEDGADANTAAAAAEEKKVKRRRSRSRRSSSSAAKQAASIERAQWWARRLSS